MLIFAERYIKLRGDPGAGPEHNGGIYTSRELLGIPQEELEDLAEEIDSLIVIAHCRNPDGASTHKRQQKTEKGVYSKLVSNAKYINKPVTCKTKTINKEN